MSKQRPKSTLQTGPEVLTVVMKIVIAVTSKVTVTVRVMHIVTVTVKLTTGDS